MDFDWIEIKRYGLPDEPGNYLCAFSDNTIETCHYWGTDDTFWTGKGPGPYKVTHFCVIEDNWHPDYDPSPDDQEDVTRIGGWGRWMDCY